MRTSGSDGHLPPVRKRAHSRQCTQLLTFALLAALCVAGALAVSASACEPKKPSELEIIPKNPSAKNIEEVKECAGDPVDCATGDLSESQTDLMVGGRGPKLEVSLTYNSLVAVAESEKSEPGAFGYGWTGPYTASVTFASGTEIATVHQNNGSTAVFFLSGGKYTPEAWIESKFVTSGSDYIFTTPQQTQLEFNSSGQLIKETDRNGNAITMTYNGSKQLEKIKDEAGRELTFTYSSGLVESVKDPMGRTVKYTHASGNLTGVTLPGESGKERWKFEYNGSHEMTSMTDGRSEKTTTEYEASHRVSKQTDPMGHETKWTYSSIAGGTETVINEPNGSETVEQFNIAGEPTKVTRAHGTALASTIKSEYNSSFELVLMTNPDEHSTEYTYDSEDNRTGEKDPNGNETKWKYDSTHDIETETTPKSEVTTIKRNADGDPTVIERTVGGKKQETKYKYDGNGDVTEETNALGFTTEFKYDGKGDKTEEIDPEGDKRTWEYNTDSEVIEEVSPRGNALSEPSKYKTTSERDEQGQPLKITDPLGHTIEYTYNGDGNVETETDGNSHVTKYVYNEDDERTKVEEPKSTTETEYDTEGQVKAQIDGNKNKTEYKRNALEEIEEEINPLSQKTKKKYDAAGNLTEMEDAESRKTTYKYDLGNRLTEIAYSEGSKPTVKYEYDKDGDVTKMVDSTGESTYTYDEIDRLTETKDAHGNTVKYEYNLDNQPTEITYPNTKKVTRVYDKDGRLTEVKDWLGNTSKFKYDPDSDLTATIFPSGTENEDTYAYNKADQMSEVAMLKKSTEVASLTYTRDDDAQVEQTVNKGLPKEETVAYTNDEDKRLTKAGSTTYEYDAANNPTKLGATTCKYNAGDEIEKCGETTYEYNNMGQRTKANPKTSSEDITYEYNQAGVLTGVKRTTPEINDSYAYNGSNLRVSETIKSATNYLAWDTAEKMPLLLNDGTNSYIYGPGNLPIEQINSSEEPTYLHHDQQGSTRMLTNSTGEDKGAYTYGPYGNTEEHTGTATTPLEYDAQYTSTDTGLIYLRAREYDPTSAQFLTVDSKEASTGASYSYGGDNPVNEDDPSGLSEEENDAADNSASQDIPIFWYFVFDGNIPDYFKFIYNPQSWKPIPTIFDTMNTEAPTIASFSCGGISDLPPIESGSNAINPIQFMPGSPGILPIGNLTKSVPGIGNMFIFGRWSYDDNITNIYYGISQHGGAVIDIQGQLNSGVNYDIGIQYAPEDRKEIFLFTFGIRF
jgi:RHS repeat-associated protein